MTILNLNNGGCPSKEVFDVVLSQKATFEVELEFYEHIKECPLCSDAYEGYKASGLTPKSIITQDKFNKSKVISLKKYLAYAASILFLIGGVYLFKGVQNDRVSLAFVETPYVTYSNGNSFVKSTDTYWTINANGNILLNDQIIDEGDIENVSLVTGSKAYVSVHSDDKETPSRIINKLKQREVAVLVY